MDANGSWTAVLERPAGALFADFGMSHQALSPSQVCELTHKIGPAQGAIKGALGGGYAHRATPSQKPGLERNQER